MSLNQITLLPVFPLWLILLLLSLGLGAAIFQYLLIRTRLGRSRALGISLLRLGAITLLICFLLNPSFTERKEHKVLPTLAILLDTSQSMGLPAHEGKDSRLEEAKAFLLNGDKPLLKSLAESYEVKLYGLGDSLRILDVSELSSLKAGGKGVDLNEALRNLRGKNSLAILLSDGNLRGEDENLLDLPLIAIPVGAPERYKDILIKAVKAPALAFRGREVPIDITIKGYGYTGLTLPVLLKDGTKLLTVKNVRINKSPFEVTLSLSFIPDEVGQHNLSLSIPTQFGEALTTNNTVNLSLNIVRDKIRILMISGNPSLSYRFMRTAFKNDPSIDLLSFVILRTPSDILNVPLQEQSLIPLPVDTLFSKELKEFDLLIFDNYPYHLYFNPMYLESVREFVKGGGSFATIGGPNFSGEYVAGTPIEEILPVKLRAMGNYHRAFPSGVRLTHVGTTHPITCFFPSESDNLSLWREMPPLDGINLWEPKSSGTVLLESTDGIPRPILTVGSFGKGRVLALATDYSWKWYMGPVAKGKGNWAYLRLIERMVRWLTKDPSLDPVQIILPERARAVGQELEIRVKVREEGFSSNLKAAVSFSVFNPDGAKIRSQLKVLGQPGEFLGSFFPEKEGTYKVRVETPSGKLEDSIVIAGQMGDLDGAPDHEWLRTISASTGGKTFSKGDDFLKEIETYAGTGGNRFVEERRFPLWSSPYLLGLILFLLTMEWYLRRRWGMV